MVFLTWECSLNQSTQSSLGVKSAEDKLNTREY